MISNISYMISNISYIISINILLGAPSIGRGSAQPSGGGGWIQRSKIRLQSRSKYSKTAQKWPVSRTY